MKSDEKLPVSPYVEVEAMGSQIGLLACGLCGATLLLVSDPPDGEPQTFPNTPELHHAFHAKLEDRERRFRATVVVLTLALILVSIGAIASSLA